MRVSFMINLKEEDKYPEHIYSRDEEGAKASEIRSAIAKEFAGYIIEGSKENQPYIYVTLVPIREKNSKMAASITSPDLSFKNEVREELIAFVKSY